MNKQIFIALEMGSSIKIKLFNNIEDAYNFKEFYNPYIIVHTLTEEEINIINNPNTNINVTLFINYGFYVEIKMCESPNGFIIPKKQLLRLLN